MKNYTRVIVSKIFIFAAVILASTHNDAVDTGVQLTFIPAIRGSGSYFHFTSTYMLNLF